MKDRNVISVPVSNLLPGAVAARDIYTRNDQLLIPRDHMIDGRGITRITLFGILSVPVYENDELLDQMDEDDIDDSIFTPEEKEDFLAFKQSYDLTTSIVAKNMNQLLKANEEVDSKTLIDEVNKLVFRSRSKYHVFDMIHQIKGYDDETYRHSLNVAMICSVFADWLGMNKRERHSLMMCGLLHDVGKLQIRRDVLRKPSRLTDQEYEEIKQHPLRGYEVLKDKKIPEAVKRAVLLHHERCDGKGYPFGFTMKEIDPYAAITAIADVYEAMTATRVYRTGMSPFDVIRIFEEDGKNQFNPNFLVPLLGHLTDTYLQHDVEISDGLRAKVILINRDELSRPTVMLESGEFLDLSKRRDLAIVKVF